MPLHGIDHVELWVGNAAQAAYYFRHAFGFTEVAYAGLETGLRDRVSHVLQQGRIRLVLTGTLRVGTDVAAHQRVHGDGVKVIALSVPRRRGTPTARRPRAAPAASPSRSSSTDEHGTRAASPRSPPTARPSTASSSAAATPGRSCPATAAVAHDGDADGRALLARHRPRRRQRRARRRWNDVGAATTRTSSG